MEKLRLDIQKFANGSIDLSYSSHMTGRIVWSSVSNGTSANSSTVYADLYVRRTDSYSTTGTFKGAINIDGTYINVSYYGSVSSSWVKVGSYSREIKHNEDGSRNCWIGADLYGPSGTSLSGEYCTGGATVTLDKIDRYAVITSAPNFNDEENPTITYSNPAGNNVTSLQACISLTGATDDIKYRDIPKTGTSYTFNLTEAERNVLRQATPNSNSLNVIFFVRTEISGLVFFTTLTRTMSIINANPTFSNFDFNDVNPVTLALTGNSKYNINGYSTIKAIISTINKAVAKKGATMSTYRFTCGDKTSQDDMTYSENQEVSGTINGTPNGIYNVYATDSRNNTTLVTKLATKVVEYTPIYIDRQNTTTYRDKGGVGDNVTLKYSGTIWNDNFGVKSNSIKSASYRFKKTTDNKWIPGKTNITPTVDGNKFTFEALVKSNNADYTFDIGASYNFEITITDQLSTDTFELTPLGSAIPNLALADNGVGIMGAYDEEVGGKLQVGGKKLENIINDSYVSKIATATLSNKISYAARGQIPFNLINSTTDKLTLSSYGIRIGKGVSKVLISGNAFLHEYPATAYGWCFIRKNSNNIAESIASANAAFVSCAFSPLLIDVQEGDFFDLYINNPNSGSIRAKGTYLTVEVIE